MGQDQSKKSNLKRKDGGKKIPGFQISHSNIGGDLMNIGNIDDFEVDEYNFEEISVLKWDFADIEEWLEQIEIKPASQDEEEEEMKLKKDFSEKFLEKIKTGTDLFQMKFSDPLLTEFFKDDDEEHKELKLLFSVYLQHVKKCVKEERRNKKKSDKDQGSGLFSLKFHRVLQKIMKGLKEEGNNGMNYKQLEHYVSLLSCKHKIKKYLLDGKSVDDKETKVKVKLIITENTFDSKEQFVRKIISPIVSIVPKFKPQFGFFHSALLIGKYYLQWSDSEIIIPKKIISSGCALISLDTDPIEIESGRDFDEIKSVIAETIEKWNCNYKYVQLRKDSYEGNCQDFILDLTKKLDIDINKGDKVIGEYLNKFTKRGYFKIQFKPTEQFVKDFKLSELPDFSSTPRSKKGDKRLKFNFKNHRSLDKFLYHCFRAFPDGQFKYPSEYRLLKSFDRAFWLRHLKFPDSEQYKPLEAAKGRKFGDVNPSGCVFADPRSTGSYY